jgi:uncharacterized membrane protein
MVNNKEIYQLFKVSVLIKGAISLVEIVVGIIVLFIPITLFTTLAEILTRGELTEEPTSFVATHLVSGAHALTAVGGGIIAIYLMSRGAIKLGLIIALLKNKVWAYPWSLGVLGLFVLYQLYELVKTHSIAIIAVTLFDLIVMYFIWREYKIVKTRHAT